MKTSGFQTFLFYPEAELRGILLIKLLNEINGGFGGAYKPSNPLYVLAAMVAQHSACNALQGDVNTRKGIFEPFQNAKVAEFKDVQKLARRLRTAAKTCGAGEGFYIDVNKIVTKILGGRASKPVATPTDPAGTSASQVSYDNTVNNFDALAKMLAGEVLFAPNEADLTVASVTVKTAALDSTNNNVKSSAVPYNNAVLGRNKALYTEKTGLCAVGQGSKDYLRQVFGFSSAEFKLVTKIEFRNRDLV